MYLIAGLGNPGSKYKKTRHNVGFMAVDGFAEAHRAPASRERFEGEFTKVTVGAHEVGLLKPATYMNLSGRSVQKALHFFKLDLSSLIVVHDELDLPFGTLRIKSGGGMAGHNGLQSIGECCGGPDFVRLRIGVGRPKQSGADHVLSDFSAQEYPELADVLERATAALTDILGSGTQAAMNKHNQR